MVALRELLPAEAAFWNYLRKKTWWVRTLKARISKNQLIVAVIDVRILPISHRLTARTADTTQPGGGACILVYAAGPLWPLKAMPTSPLAIARQLPAVLDGPGTAWAPGLLPVRCQ